MGKKKKTDYLRKCPECGSNGLEKTIRNNTVNMVSYTKEFIYCIFCGYEKEYKRKGSYKNLFEDD